MLAKHGRMLIFTKKPEELSSLFDGDPSVAGIGEAIAFFRRERKAYESKQILVYARRIISEAHLSFSSTGLIQAVEYGMYKEVQAFLRAGFSPDTENPDGVSILSIAVRNGDMEVCRLLMSYNASLNVIARDRRSSPLMDAVSSNKIEIAELLIKAASI